MYSMISQLWRLGLIIVTHKTSRWSFGAGMLMTLGCIGLPICFRTMVISVIGNDSCWTRTRTLSLYLVCREPFQFGDKNIGMWSGGMYMRGIDSLLVLIRRGRTASKLAATNVCAHTGTTDRGDWWIMKCAGATKPPFAATAQITFYRPCWLNKSMRFRDDSGAESRGVCERWKYCCWDDLWWPGPNGVHPCVDGSTGVGLNMPSYRPTTKPHILIHRHPPPTQ